MLDTIKNFFIGLWESIKTNNSNDWTSFFQGLIHVLIICLPIGMVLSEAVFKSTNLAQFISYNGVWCLAIAQVSIIVIYYFNKPNDK